MASHGLFPEDLTVRALVGGVLVGSLLCCTNLYLGLQSAFITMASMQAALVGFGLLRSVTAGTAQQQQHARRRSRRNVTARGSEGRDDSSDNCDDHAHRPETAGETGLPGGRRSRLRHHLLAPFTAQENAVLQATAVALGSTPLSAGLIGIVPAFSLLSPAKDGDDAHPFKLSWPSLVLWCTAMAYFGIFFASPLRVPIIVREKLRFPSGSATAQLIALLHGERLRDDEASEKAPTGSLQGSQRPGRVTRTRSTHSQLPQDCADAGSSDDEGRNTEDDFEGTQRYNAERRPLLRRSATEREAADDVRQGWPTLVTTFAASMSLALASFAFPVLYAMPIFDLVLPCHDAASKWGWYATPSLSYVGQGIIMGPQATISMFAGAVTGWAILSPLVHYLGWTNGIPTDAEEGSQAWNIWVALAIMTSESIVGLALVGLQHRRAESASADGRTGSVPSRDFELAARQTPRSWIIAGLGLSSLIASTLIYVLFSARNLAGAGTGTGTALQLWVPPVGIVLAGLLSVLAVRALGATDLNPVNALGKLSQLAFAFLQPGNVVVNMVGGALSEAGAMQAGELMQDYKTGHLLGASPRGQFFGQLVGSTAGIVVASAAYKLYERAYKLPGPDMPAPAARLWLNFARLINNGSLPPHSGAAMVFAGAVFALTTLARGMVDGLPAHSHARQRLRWVQWLPNGVAFAVGLGLNSPNYSLARLVGGLVVMFVQSRRDRHVAQRRRRQYDAARNCTLGRAPRPPPAPNSSKRSLPPVTLLIWSAGFVLGEGFASIIVLFLKQAGLDPISCWGCRGGCAGGC